MTPNVDEEILLRGYLLGQLDSQNQKQLEERLLSNAELVEQLLIAEEELVDDYVRESLSAAETEKFESFFLSTPQRRQAVQLARALRRYASKQVQAVTPPSSHVEAFRQKWFSGALLPVAASVLLVLGLGFGIRRFFFFESPVRPGLAALHAAYRGQRPLEARIAGFAYAPFPRTRGSERAVSDYLQRDRAERLLLDAVSEEPGPASHHALGQFYLTERQYDKAIDRFHSAVNADPHIAQYHADLGAALLERAGIERSGSASGKAVESQAQALKHLNRAIELDGSLLEALFNRALCHQEMAQREQAHQDWQKYLQLDSGSPWAEEARQYLKQL